MGKQILTVEDLTKIIKAVLEEEELLHNLWIRGEISNCKLHTSGHLYFTLKDAKASLRCVMFRSRTSSLNFLPQDGMRVLVKGNVSVYEPGGQYQLYADEISLDGAGELYLALEQLKNRLAAEGLFAPDRKRPVPLLPRRIGVVTSLTGAALRDIVNVVRRRYPAMGIIVAPASVQGENAHCEIAQAIDDLNACGEELGVIIVGRGGGSMEELWAFNHETVVRAIARSKIPVISAVGHQTDFTLADFVSDMRAPTPSAAAELAVCEYRELVSTLQGYEKKLAELLICKVQAHRDQIGALLSRLRYLDPLRQVEQYFQRVDELRERLGNAMEREYKMSEQKAISSIGRLTALSPLGVLSRGYSLCQKQNGMIIRSAAQVETGEIVKITLAKGNLACLVSGKEERENA